MRKIKLYGDGTHDSLVATIYEDDNLHYVPGFYFAHYETEEK